MKGSHQEEKSKRLLTLATLCIVVGFGVVGLSQWIIGVDLGVYLLAIGSGICASGLILLKIIAESGNRGLQKFDGLLVIGVVLISVGLFSGLELLVFGGIALQAVRWIPQAAQFVRSIGCSLVKAYREISAKG